MVLMKKIIVLMSFLFLVGFVCAVSVQMNTINSSSTRPGSEGGYGGETSTTNLAYKDNPVCDVTTPCPDGLSCVNFPSDGLKCAIPNPCSYYDCPGNTKCVELETYPSRVMCSGENSCVGEECMRVVSYNIVTGEETVSDINFKPSTGSSSGGSSGSSAGFVGTFTVSDGVPVSYKEKLKVEDTRLYMEDNNGVKAEVKIMPEVASERAIERLGELNFSVELKNVGVSNEVRPVYEVSGMKHGRFLGLFKVKADVSVEVDADTGNVKVRKPWWGFLAGI